jgi:hypothetical protein
MTTPAPSPARHPLAYRPVISCGEALLPGPRGLESLPLHRGITFRGHAFHPERPWLAICTLTIGSTEANPAETRVAIAVNAQALRLIAAQMIEIADHLDIKPASKSENRETRK